jgi:hypothetical protein
LGVPKETLIQGRPVPPEQIDWLREWIQVHPQWSRKRLARQLCERWQWRDTRGRLKDFAARSLLLKLAAQGQLTLPPLQVHQRRAPRAAPAWPQWQEPAPWSAPLAAVAPVRLEPVRPGTPAVRTWAFYLHRYHYRGLRVVGENFGYLALDAHGREVGCLLFGAPAWRCAARDQALGWSESTRRQRLHTLANNTRFLILPWVRVPHLASHLLGRAARRIAADWQVKYGHGLDWLETFVERDRFAGTCYRAANWICVGQTQGRSRQDRHHTTTVPVKDVYLYRLRGGAR